MADNKSKDIQDTLEKGALSEIKKKEKEEVNAFRKDIKDLSYYQWTKKYVTGDTKK